MASVKRQIKYSDKSVGQPSLIPIFNRLKEILGKYEKGHLKLVSEKMDQFQLSSDKPVEIQGKKQDGIYFASILIQKGYVGFYYFPVYVETDLKAQLFPELLKCLKGKTCFHIKKVDDVLFNQIDAALKLGYDLYKENKWI